MWEIAGWVALGAVLMLLFLVALVRWTDRQQARKEWEEGERLRKAVEADDMHCLKREVRTLERQLDLMQGNVEYLQTQNAGQGTVLGKLEEQVDGLMRRLP